MKKTILILSSVFFIGSTMVSCKKDYVCKCSKTYTSGTGGTNTSSHSQFTYRENRARAEERCNGNATTGSDLFGNYSINCQIQ